METIQSKPDGECIWMGMSNFGLVSPNGLHTIDLPYLGEPPHGDSYHQIIINGRKLPWLAWGCFFAFTSTSTHLAFSARQETISRHTVVVDLLASKYCVLPTYIYEFRFEWPRLVPTGHSLKERINAYCFTGNEAWTTF